METEPELLWAVHKSSRIYEGGTYRGPSLIVASLPLGPYETFDQAQWVASKLSVVNHVGFEVVPYRPRGDT